MNISCPNKHNTDLLRDWNPPWSVEVDRITVSALKLVKKLVSAWFRFR